MKLIKVKRSQRIVNQAYDATKVVSYCIEIGNRPGRRVICYLGEVFGEVTLNIRFQGRTGFVSKSINRCWWPFINWLYNYLEDRHNRDYYEDPMGPPSRYI